MTSKTAETCKFCKKVVVIDPVKEGVDGVYMIANCDSCNAMTCRECLTTDNEGKCKGCYDDDETYPCACCDKEMTLDETNTVDEYDGWVCDACREELSSDDDDQEDIGLCGSCKIQLDHLRDGTEEDGHRCHNCYWTEEGLDKGVELITPDYRNIKETYQIWEVF